MKKEKKNDTIEKIVSAYFNIGLPLEEACDLVIAFLIGLKYLAQGNEKTEKDVETLMESGKLAGNPLREELINSSNTPAPRQQRNSPPDRPQEA